MTEIYKQKMIDHYRNPRNFGKMENFTHSFKVQNLSCGDTIEVWLEVDDNGTIEEATFFGDGCVIALASSSLLTEQIKGKKITEVSNYTSETIVNMLGIELQPARLKCALMSLEATQKALQTGIEKNEQLN
jgi:nitrogen fixation protein NifU and related proteins